MGRGAGGVNTTGLACPALPRLPLPHLRSPFSSLIHNAHLHFCRFPVSCPSRSRAHQKYSAATCCEPLYSSTASTSHSCSLFYHTGSITHHPKPVCDVRAFHARRGEAHGDDVGCDIGEIQVVRAVLKAGAVARDQRSYATH